MSNPKISPLEGMVPELQKVIQDAGLDPTKASLAIPIDPKTQRPFLRDRQELSISDGEKGTVWMVPSLRALFRGQAIPPDLSRYPVEYRIRFYAIEGRLALVFKLVSRSSDQEMQEVFHALRRRPDGRSLGPIHDWVWNFAAYMLGRFPTSQAEFEAIFAQLAHSARRFSMSLQSYNYAEYLEQLDTDDIE